MTYLGMRELKENMGRFVTLIRKGEPVGLSYHGKPLAVVRSLPGQSAIPSAEEKHLLHLERRGLVAGGKGRVRSKCVPLKIGGRNISDIVIAERE